MSKTWKYQATMAENGITELSDPALSQSFVEQAEQFIASTLNPESHPAKLDELDVRLVELFYTLHDISVRSLAFNL